MEDGRRHSSKPRKRAQHGDDQTKPYVHFSRASASSFLMLSVSDHERLRVDFAKKAKEFVEWIDQQKADLEVDGELEVCFLC